MKKLLILAATTAVISSSSAFADILDMNNQFYLKASAGVNKLLNFKVEDDQIDETIKLTGKYAPTFNLAVGYYATNEFRAELEAGYTNAKMKSKTFEILGLDLNKYQIQGTYKPRVITLMLSGYYDLDLDVVKPFLGGGVGVAATSGKIIVSTTPVVDGRGTASSDPIKFKTKYNFSYHLTAGVGAEVSEGVTAEFAYKFQNYGKKLKGHNLTAGIRFAI